MEDQLSPSEWEGKMEDELSPSEWEAKLERKNATISNWQTAGDTTVLLAAQHNIERPHWFFKKWRNGCESFVHLSKWDSDTIEAHFGAFVKDPKSFPRVVYVRTGTTGQDLYQLNFWPMPSDFEELTQLQLQNMWTPQEMARHQLSWSTAMLSRQDPNPNHPLMFLYTKIRSIKGPASAPSRLLFRRSVDSMSDLRATIDRFPAWSAKDLDAALAEFHMTKEQLETCGAFGPDALQELAHSRRTSLPSTPAVCRPVWLWLHSSGWRVSDSRVSAIYEANHHECVTGTGATEVFYNTGKSLKKLSFVPVLTDECFVHAGRILAADPSSDVVRSIIDSSRTYFLQGDADWSLSDTTVNWRLVCRVDESSLNFRNANRFRLYQQYPRLSSYDIEKVWAEHGFPNLSTGTSTSDSWNSTAQTALRLATLAKIHDLARTARTSDGIHTHIVLKNILSALENEVESFMSITNTVLDDILVCPVGLCRFVQPVITPHGHTYERDKIENWLTQNSVDPMTMNPLSIDQLRPDTLSAKLLRLFHNVRLDDIPRDLIQSASVPSQAGSSSSSLMNAENQFIAVGFIYLALFLNAIRSILFTQADWIYKHSSTVKDISVQYIFNDMKTNREKQHIGQLSRHPSQSPLAAQTTYSITNNLQQETTTQSVSTERPSTSTFLEATVPCVSQHPDQPSAPLPSTQPKTNGHSAAIPRASLSFDILSGISNKPSLKKVQHQPNKNRKLSPMRAAITARRSSIADSDDEVVDGQESDDDW
jgi:hypothetical protein